jgi:hypothetical protein
MTLPWAFWELPPEAISLVAEKFVLANGFTPQCQISSKLQGEREFES